MSNTTTTTTTPAATTPKAATAKQLHSGKVTAASRAHAKGLQAPAVRDGYFKDGKGFAVDVQRDNGSSAYAAGVITRFFNDRAEAVAFAAAVNAGNGKGPWYAAANRPRNAKVVPAYNVPVGKTAVDVLKAAAAASNRAANKAAKAAATTALPAATPATTTPVATG